MNTNPLEDQMPQQSTSSLNEQTTSTQVNASSKESVQQSSISGKNIFKHKYTPLIVGVLVIVIAFAGYVGFRYWQGRELAKNLNTNSGINVIDDLSKDSMGQGVQTPLPPDYYSPPGYEKDFSTPPIQNTNVTWYSEPKEVSDLQIVAGYRDDLNGGVPADELNKIKYYELGTNGSNKIILAQGSPVSPVGASDIILEQTSDGYKLMQLMTSTDIYTKESPVGFILSSKVVASDNKTFYKGIVGPFDFEYQGVKMKSTLYYPIDLFSNYFADVKKATDSKISKLASTPDGDIYQLEQRVNGQDSSPSPFNVRRYLLRSQAGFYVPFVLTYNFFTDDQKPNITWADGKKNTDAYRLDGSLGGCGYPGGYAVPVRDISSAVAPSGKTSTGETIYELIDKNDTILKFFYDAQGGKVWSEAKQDRVTISYEDWLSHHPVIFYKNSVGEYLVFTNDAYGIGAECGKPVIYLYPTQPTKVSVKVGADISVSEPSYGKGWNVLAKPDGSLFTNSGARYDSLFWEGLGHGMYPNITSGFVVPQNEIKTALQNQLSAQGLNQKESQDFMDFWLDKMPKTPYVRLTWFNTQLMDELAPLFVYPKPQTTIRVFLDFQGMQNFVNIPNQTLTAPARQGFTLVEWGGLLKK